MPILYVVRLYLLKCGCSKVRINLLFRKLTISLQGLWRYQFSFEPKHPFALEPAVDVLLHGDLAGIDKRALVHRVELACERTLRILTFAAYSDKANDAFACRIAAGVEFELPGILALPANVSLTTTAPRLHGVPSSLSKPRSIRSCGNK